MLYILCNIYCTYNSPQKAHLRCELGISRKVIDDLEKHPVTKPFKRTERVQYPTNGYSTSEFSTDARCWGLGFDNLKLVQSNLCLVWSKVNQNRRWKTCIVYIIPRNLTSQGPEQIITIYINHTIHMKHKFDPQETVVFPLF